MEQPGRNQRELTTAKAVCDRIPDMVRDLPEKLRLTLLVLNCTTQKELVAKLIRLNPDTSYSPEKAYKWMKGVSRPRDAQIYADLAELLGLDGGAVFFQTSRSEAFKDRIMRAGREGASLATAMPPDLGRSRSRAATRVYACFSPAWSVTKSGEIVIGRLALRTDGEQIHAEYSEVHGGKRYPYAGEFFLQGTSMFGMLRSPKKDLSIYLCLNQPSRAGLFLGGVFSGAALNDPFTRPCACRIGCFLIEGGDEARFPTGYANGNEGVASALHAFGLTEGLSAPFARAVAEMLAAPPSQGLVDISLDDAIRIETLLFQVQERPPE